MSEITDQVVYNRLNEDRPRWLPGHLIEITAYDGKLRDDAGEVYAVSWNYAQADWMYHVRCFVAEGQEQRFRCFAEKKLEAR